MRRLDGKVVVVSGSTAGIGEGIARRAAQEGARLVIHGTKEEGARAVVASIEAEGGSATYRLGDLRDPDVPTAVVRHALETYGRVDAVVNNAAISTRSTLQTTTPEFFDEIMAINARAPMLFCQAAVPHFVEQRSGSIVNIGSINAYAGGSTLLAYSMTKGALMTLSRNLAITYAEDGVRTNLLNIGWTLTDNEHQLQLSDGQPEDWVRRIPGKIMPFGRMFYPKDIAAWVAFLLSEDGELVNGAVIDVNQTNLHGRLWF